MSTQFYATATRFDTPLNIDGVDYSFGVKFNSQPYSPAIANSIVSGRFVEITGTTNKTIACARQERQCSYTKTNGPRDTIEIQYPALCGGNIAECPEPARIYSHLDSTSNSGGDSFKRAQPGDVLVWQGRHFLVLEAEPYSIAPGEIAWQGTEPLQYVSYYQVNLYDVEIPRPVPDNDNPDVTWYFDSNARSSSVFSFLGLYVFDSGGGATRAARKTFEAPTRNPSVSNYYPPNAQFSSSVPEYWYDEENGEVRLGSGCSVIGNDVGIWSAYSNLEKEEVLNEYQVLEGSGNGYDDSADDLSGVAEGFQGDFLKTFFIYPNNSWGQGSVEVRLNYGSTSEVLAVTWDGTSLVNSVRRDVAGGTITTASVSGTNSGLFATLQVERVGNTITFYHNGSSVCSVDWSSVTDEDSSLICSICNWGVDKEFLFYSSGTQFIAPFSPGTWSKLVFSYFENIVYEQEITLPSSNALNLVDFINVDGELSLSSIAARNHYGKPAANKIKVYSETNGDTIRFVQAADTEAPSKPGRPPRVSGTENFATFAEGGEEGTSVLSENKAHYYDKLIVLDSEGILDAVEGDSFQIIRGGVFDPRNPPVVQFDIKNGAGDWATLASSNYKARWLEGYLLIKKSWTDANLSSGDKLCLRVVGNKFNQAGRMEARQWNDFQHAIESLDDGWFGVNLGGNGTAMNVETQGVWGIVPSEYSLNTSTCEIYASAYMIGALPIPWRTIIDRLKSGVDPKSNPVGEWDIVDGWITQYQAAGNNPGALSSDDLDDIYPNPTLCPSSFYNEEGVGVYSLPVLVRPYGNPYGTNWFGCQFAATLIGSIPSYAGFSTIGNPINIDNGPLSRIPDGSTILSAKLPVQFDGFSSVKIREDLVYNQKTEIGTFKMYANGTLVQDVAYNPSFPAGYNIIQNDPIVASSDGEVSFHLYGKRLNTGEVYLPYYGFNREFPDHKWRSFAGGTVSGGTVSSGKIKIIDIKSAVQALIGARNTAYRDFELWPGGAVDIAPDGGTGNMAAAAESFMPRYTSFSYEPIIGEQGLFDISWSRTFSYSQFASLSIGTLHVRVRMPSGAIDDLQVPMSRQAIINRT